MNYEEIQAERLALVEKERKGTISQAECLKAHSLLDIIERQRMQLNDEHALTESQEEVISELREEIESLRAAMERWRKAADAITALCK